MFRSSLGISNLSHEVDWTWWRKISLHFAALQPHLKLVNLETLCEDLLKGIREVISEIPGLLQWSQWLLAAWDSFNTCNSNQNLEEYYHSMFLVGDNFTWYTEYDVAMAWFKRLLSEAEKVFRSDHTIILEVTYTIARIYSIERKNDLALQYFQRSILIERSKQSALSERGASNSTIETCYNPAKSSESCDQNLKWDEEILAWKEKILVSGVLRDLARVESMAFLYQNQGRSNVALEWCKEVFVRLDRMLGPNHPSTLKTMYNIGVIYSERGNYELALKWYQHALSGREKILSPYHTHTLSTVHNIAFVYGQQEQYNLALQWYQRVLAGREKVLGPDHTDTLSTVHNIGFIYGKREQYEFALQWYQRAFAGREKVLGPYHTHTLNTVHNIAFIYGQQKQYGLALQWYQQALTERETLLGLIHSDTLLSMEGLVGVCYELGNFEKAERHKLGLQQVHDAQSGSQLNPTISAQIGRILQLRPSMLSDPSSTRNDLHR